MVNLFTLFERLKRLHDQDGMGTQFVAYPIPNYKKHRIARDQDGAPCLLISCNATDGIQHAPIHLEHLGINHNEYCQIVRPDRSQETGYFTVIRCINADRLLQRYFLRVAGSLIVALGANPSSRAITESIGYLIKLFRAAIASPRKTVQGLWAELFLIYNASDPYLLTAAWHTTPRDRYDFSDRNQRIEVKSASNHIRRHHFSLEQLNPPTDVTVLIASLFVEPSSSGISLAQLIDGITSYLRSDADLLLHLEKVIGLTLGASWRNVMDLKFDQNIANQSLHYIESTRITRISSALPDAVSEVHFKSDLTGLAPIMPAWLKAERGLFRAALPRKH